MRRGDLVAAGPGAHWFVILLVARARRSKAEIVDADLGIAAERIRRTAQSALGSQGSIGVRCGWSVLELGGASRLDALRQAVRGAAVVARVEERRALTLAGITHELRTPLTAIIGFAERLKEKGLDDRRRSRALDIIIEEARRLTRLTDGLIDIGTWTAGHLQLRRTPCDLGSLLAQAAAAIRDRAEAKNVQIRINHQTAALSLDKDRCLQVFLNLFDNAVRHAPDGSAVTVGITRGSKECSIMFCDQGPGFAPAARVSLGQPFARGQNGRSGLGLAICKVIVDAHGGTLRFASGKGGRISVSFPVSQDRTHVCE